MDEKTFDIYKNKLTCSINQADSDWATELVARYQPKSVEEMSAFVAIIRPGCAKLLQDFIDRKPYTTGVKALDDLLIEGNHRMIYQELIMKYLIWLGIPETGSYDIIKKISKKKFKEAELAELRSKLSKGWLKQVGTMDGFDGTWGIVQDAAHYSFNSSHSLSYAYDSLYGAYLKSHYPLEYYTVALNSYRDDSARTTRLTKELEYFDIKLKPVKFRHSRADYSMSKSENSIYKGISSIKNLNAKCAEEMYELREKQYDDFISVLYDLKEFTSINSKQINILIELDFFEEFGDRNLLKQQYLLFDKFADRKTFKKEEIDSLGIPLAYIREFAGKESEKQFSQMNMAPLIHMLADHIEYTPHTLNELIEAQVEYLGYVDIPPNPRFSGYAVVLDIDTKFSPKVKLHSLKNGTLLDCKINKKTFKKTPLEKGNVIKIQKVNKKPKVHKDDSGKWVEIPDTSELWVSDYFLANLRSNDEQEI